jgi:membrane-associated phospholipid phosphatase
VADALSYLLHPAVPMVLTMFQVSLWTRGSLGWAFLDVGMLILGLFPGLLYIYVKTRRGQFTHYHLLLKEERRVVLPLLFFGMVVSFGLYLVTNAPTLMLRGMIVGLFAGLGAIIISRFWKMSLHAAVSMGCAALFIPISWTTAAVFAALGITVGVARLVVRHHTPAQVIVGWAYGFLVSAVLVRWLIG